MSQGKRIVIAGAGYAGLASAALLAAEGHDVTLLEKNDGPGGRGRAWRSEGFIFDMGPSWYLMPEVFDMFFRKFNVERSDYYELVKLSTYYQVFFGDDQKVLISDDLEETKRLFDSFEQGGARKLEAYLALAKDKYHRALDFFLYRDYKNITELLSPFMIAQLAKFDVFTGLDPFVRRHFTDTRSRQLLEYAMVFLGSSPQNAPAAYSLMSHVDLDLGVYFPKGGMISVGLALEKLAKEMGARIEYNAEVTAIRSSDGRVRSVESRAGEVPADVVLVCSDYAQAECELLSPEDQSYPRKYWQKATVAPSMLLAFLGSKKTVQGLAHHNLYFSPTWDDHFTTLFKKPGWPSDPCFYTSVVSKTDPSVAPPGGENMFMLVPLSADLEDTDEAREKLFEETAAKLASLTGGQVTKDLAVRRLFSHRDFTADYNALRGSALGLSHTFWQSAVFRPRRRSRTLRGLYYAGQYTHPGVGVPMALIAAELAAGAIREDLA